jgi:hypothetical protein
VRAGTCKLCKVDNQQLCDSHYLPKKVYGIARSPQLRSPLPFVLGGPHLKQASDQLRDYVFCQTCEERLNKNGERLVLANIPQDYESPFPLQAALKSLKPTLVRSDVDVYDVTGVEAFEVDKLVYFAASMFWRGAIHDWATPSGLGAPAVELCWYEEPLRKFLMGEALLPDDVTVTVGIWHAKVVLQAAYVPCPSHLPECQRYWFYIPGIIFSLYFGKGIPVDVRQRDARKNIVVVDVLEITSIYEMTRSAVRSQVIAPKAKLTLKEVEVFRQANPRNS